MKESRFAFIVVNMQPSPYEPNPNCTLKKTVIFAKKWVFFNLQENSDSNLTRHKYKILNLFSDKCNSPLEQNNLIFICIVYTHYLSNYIFIDTH